MWANLPVTSGLPSQKASYAVSIIGHRGSSQPDTVPIRSHSLHRHDNRAHKRLGDSHGWGASFSIIHYTDVKMTTMTSQITSLTVVYSTVYSDADQRKHQSSATLAFVWGIHRDRWIPRTKGQLHGKCFHLMTSSWWNLHGENWNESDVACTL